MKASESRYYTVTPGAGDLPRLALSSPDGARAEIYLHGAHVASWIPARGIERLFMSRASEFRPGAPIRGGVPLVFPQFAMLGPLPQHGFARLQEWAFTGVESAGKSATATFRLTASKESRKMWDHAFAAELAVKAGGRDLTMTLTVKNTGNAPFSFRAALHTYLAVANLQATYVEGLAGVRYRDNVAGGAEAIQDAPRIDFPGEVNRIYFDTPAVLHLVDGDQKTVIRSRGFTDAVVWNPGAARCATMPDLEPNDYLKYVCVEAATIGTPVELAPGAEWSGNQTLSA